jgi:tetratricopeptide (TPR) repeat protein
VLEVVAAAAGHRRAADRLGRCRLTGLAAVTWQWRAAVAARNDALIARNDALSARDQAQQNFVLARKAVDDYLSRVGQNPLLKEQGLHDLRQELLEAALGYYRNFLRRQGGNPAVRADAAAAHERVGDVMIELGRPDDALAGYDQALALIEPLVRERPGDPLPATARVRLQAGRLQALRDISDRYDDAIAIFDRMKGIGEELLASGGGTEDLPEILARAYDSAAFVFRNTKRIGDALRASLRAHELAQQASRDRPGDPAAARTLIIVSAQAASLLRFAGRVNEARRLNEQGIAFGKAWVRQHPRDVEMLINLLRLEGNFAMIEKVRGYPVQALRIFHSVADALGALARENPLLIRARWNWAMVLIEVSNLQSELGRYTEAEQPARAAIGLSEEIVREVPSSSYYRFYSAYAYGALGKALRKTSSSGEALVMLRKAVAILEPSDSIMDLDNKACFLAVASTVTDPAEGPAAAERQRRDADRALATLRRAVELGWADYGGLKNDPDLDSLRSRPDFQALLMDVAFPAEPFAP